MSTAIHFFNIFLLVLPIPLTVAWLITKAHEGGTDITSCGSDYSFLRSYWILEGPRLAVILVRIKFMDSDFIQKHQ